MECKYHRILDTVNKNIWDTLNTHYEWDFFVFWLGDESDFDGIYREAFQSILSEPLTDAQIKTIEKQGYNLEKVIDKWCSDWKTRHSQLPNEKMPKSCLRVKVYEYIIKQFKKQDIIQIIGDLC